MEGPEGTLIFVEVALREPVSPAEGIPTPEVEDVEEEEDEWEEFGGDVLISLSVFLRIDLVCFGGGAGEVDNEEEEGARGRVLVVVEIAGGPSAKET